MGAGTIATDAAVMDAASGAAAPSTKAIGSGCA